MSTIDNQVLWSSNPNQNKLSRYEKCRNITEEIYKRINITFEIQKLEKGSENDLSDGSDQIDSNELSNTTDLFAYEESLSISSSACEAEIKQKTSIPINNNNNTIDSSKALKSRKTKKKFRKRVKKHRLSKGRTESEESSDEDLSYNKSVVEIDPTSKTRHYGDDDKSESPDNVVMGVPKITILTGSVFRIKDTKQKPETTDKKTKQQPETKTESHRADEKTKEQSNIETKQCSMCSLTFRGDRGLRRHVALSHILFPEDITRDKKNH